MEFITNFINRLDLWLVIVFFIIGLVLIIEGGDFFVDASSWIAEITGIPKLIIGATVVSFSTTLPELLVSLFATIGGDYAIATGNAIGSVTSNLGLIMGISIIWLPSIISKKEVTFKGVYMLLPLIITFVFAFNGLNDGKLGVLSAILLFAIFAINMFDNVRSAKKQMKLECLIGDNKDNKECRPKPTKKEVIINGSKFLIGAGAIVFGAQFLVSTASKLATLAGVSEAVIGLTIVAIGTSLPELVTTITALIKKESSLSIGNILGANIIDLTLIISICSFVSGQNLTLLAQNILLDIPICFILGAIAVVPAMFSGRFKRWQGVLILLIYIAYLTLLVIGVDKIGLATI